MIEVSLTNFFAGLVAVPLVLWGMAGLWRRFSERHARVVARRARARCRYCSAPYARTKAPKVEICPRCHAENPVGRDRRLG